MKELDPKNKNVAQRIEQMKSQINQITDSYQSPESSTFKVPNSDKQAIMMLKLVKRLRDTVRSEHNKGRMDTQTYVVESARLETIQLRINIENVIKRSNDAITRGQPGTALQLLKKGLDVLSTKNDNYSIQAREKLQKIHDNLEQRRQSRSAEELQALEERQKESDMEALFGEKKKW